MDHDIEVFVTARTVADELGISRRTLGRWLEDPEINFPRPTQINQRLFFSRLAVEAWKTLRARLSMSENAPHG